MGCTIHGVISCISTPTVFLLMVRSRRAYGVHVTGSERNRSFLFFCVSFLFFFFSILPTSHPDCLNCQSPSPRVRTANQLCERCFGGHPLASIAGLSLPGLRRRGSSLVMHQPCDCDPVMNVPGMHSPQLRAQIRRNSAMKIFLGGPPSLTCAALGFAMRRSIKLHGHESSQLLGST